MSNITPSTGGGGIYEYEEHPDSPFNESSTQSFTIPNFGPTDRIGSQVVLCTQGVQHDAIRFNSDSGANYTMNNASGIVQDTTEILLEGRLSSASRIVIGTDDQNGVTVIGFASGGTESSNFNVPIGAVYASSLLDDDNINILSEGGFSLETQDLRVFRRTLK